MKRILLVTISMLFLILAEAQTKQPVFKLKDIVIVKDTAYLKYDMTKVTGKVRDWYSNGQLNEENNYKNGILNGIYKAWFENGQLSYQATYKVGEKNGLNTQWFENGNKSAEVTYKNGVHHGIYRLWFENGRLEREVTYKNGEYHGVIRYWYENGQLKWTGLYVERLAFETPIKKFGYCKNCSYI